MAIFGKKLLLQGLSPLGLFLLAGTAVPAVAGGFLTNGLPSAGLFPGTYPFTGNETIPLDTNLPEGQVPQSESASLGQLANFFSGGGSAAATFGATFPTTGTAIGVSNGGLMTNLAADSSHNLLVNCNVGCQGGSTSNATSGVATSSTNGSAVSWLYGYNGATWDQLRDDGSKYLYTDVGAWNAGPLPVTQSGTWNITNITGTVSLPSGAATATLQAETNGPVGPGAAAANSKLVGGIYNSSPPAATNGQQLALQTDASGNLKVNIQSGGGSGGTSSSFAATFPSTGTAIGGYYSGNMVYIAADSSHNLDVNCVAGCGGGSGGSSITDGGSFTQGTTALTAIGGIYSTSVTSLTSGQAGAVQLTSDRQMFVNLGKVMGTATSVGAGVTGTGTQRVGVAQDTTTIAGSAPGTAGSASTNVITVQGIASGTAIAAAQSGTWNIGSVSALALPSGAATAANQTAALGPVGPGTAATNSTLVGAVYNSSSPSVSTGQQVSLQSDSSGNLKITCQSGCSGSGGTSAADEATFTQGTTSYSPIGGIYTSSVSNLSSGQGGAAQLTTDRMLFVNLGKVGGTSVLTGAGATGGGALRTTVAQDTTTIGGSAPGTAGSASPNVLSVQGVSSMTPIITSVQPLTSTESAITISTANTFQSAAASSGTRKGCSIQYTGGTIGYVFFGANTSASKAASFQLAPGASASCNVPGGVLTDNIAVTSATASDTFVVNIQ